MKKTFLALFLGIILSSMLFPSLVLAQDATQQPPSDQPRSLLPTDVVNDKGVTIDCIRFLKRPSLRAEVSKGPSGAILLPGDPKVKIPFLDKNGKKTDQGFEINARETALSCGIKTGRIDMWLIPFYLVRVIDFGLLLGGLLSVLFIIIGGYHLIIGSYTEDKEKGKKTILYALGGLALCLLAYTIVNLLLLFVTS